MTIVENFLERHNKYRFYHNIGYYDSYDYSRFMRNMIKYVRCAQRPCKISRHECLETYNLTYFDGQNNIGTSCDFCDEKFEQLMKKEYENN